MAAICWTLQIKCSGKWLTVYCMDGWMIGWLWEFNVTFTLVRLNRQVVTTVYCMVTAIKFYTISQCFHFLFEILVKIHFSEFSKSSSVRTSLQLFLYQGNSTIIIHPTPHLYASISAHYNKAMVFYSRFCRSENSPYWKCFQMSHLPIFTIVKHFTVDDSSKKEVR